MTREPKSALPGLAQAFQEHTSGHMEALYSDALCLTGSRSEAVELTVQTYARAFRVYDRFRCQFHPWGIAAHPQAGSTLAWLRCHMNAAFCSAILAQAETRTQPKRD